MKFIKSVIKEMHTVTWPTFRENVHNTTIVVVTGLAFALIFGAADWIFEQGITWLSK